MTDNSCPFCSCQIFFIKTEGPSFYAECQDCQARGPLGATAMDAFHLWQSRQTHRIATFPSREAALASPALDPRAIALYDQFPGEPLPAWALGILSAVDVIHYLRLDGSYK